MSQSYENHQASAAGRSAGCAVITLSDTRTLETDVSGKKIAELLQADGHRLVSHHVIPDDPTRLDDLLWAIYASQEVDAIFTTGGTGVARRDQTIDVVARHLTLPLPGFGELFRMLSWQEIGSGAMLSRAIGGVAGDRLLFAMPGSPNAVELAMTKLILPELRHLLEHIRKS